MDDRPDVDSAAAEHGFLLRFLADRKEGRELDLEDYQALYPGHETTVARKFAEIHDPAGPDPEDAGGSERIGRFRIVAELGRGGQGTVYLADDTRLSRRVALKVLRPDVGPGAAERLRRFRREAEAASRLDHPGICTVYETGEVDGAAYIAMQYVQGETLREKIERARHRRDPGAGPGSLLLDSTPSGDSSAGSRVAAVVRTFEDLARALHYSHEQGLVHRDVKPGNIVIADDGTPVILDFGLARDELDVQATLTQTGDVLGTPAYMSPEQIQATGQRLDRRTDVYSLGVTLHECLMLRLPFEAPTREALYRKILTGDRSSVPHLRRHGPRDLQVVVDTALEVDRVRRYQTAHELAEDLRRVRELRSIRARPPGPLRRLQRWCRRNPAVAVALVLLIGGLALSGYQLHREGQILRTTRALGLASASAEALETDPLLALLLAREAVLLEERSETVSPVHSALAEVHERARLGGHGGPTLVEDVWSVEFSPDGLLVLAAFGDGTARVWDLEGSEVVPPLAHGTEDTPARLWKVTSARFTPDGQRILTTCADGRARLWDLGGRQLAELDHGSFLWSAAFANGHDWVVLSGSEGASVWDLGTHQEIARLIGHEEWVWQSAFAPDDGSILTAGGYGWRTKLSNHFTARLWDLGGNQLECLEDHGDSLVDAAYSGDGTQFLTASRDGKVIVWDEHAERLFEVDHGGRLWAAAFSPAGSILTAGQGEAAVRLWSPDSVLLWQHREHAGQVLMAAFSRDGERVLTASTDMTARVLDAGSGVELATLRGHRDRVVSAAFDPDRRLVATVSRDATARLWEVSTPELPVLRGHDDSVICVAFSSDGERMLTAAEDGTVCLWSGAGELLQSPPTLHGGAVASAAFSPLDDGLVFTASRDGHVRLWDLDENELTRRTEQIFGLDCAAFDGERFLTGSNDGGARLWDLDGALIREFEDSAGALISAAFSQDGQLVVTASRDGVARVWDWRLEQTDPVRLSHDEREVQTAVFSPDGRLVLTTTGRIARLWDWLNGRVIQDLQGHEGALRSAVFSPDGQRVLTASRDRTARLWDLEGTELARFEHAGPVNAAVFSPDGRRILTACSDETARVWIAETDEALELAELRAFRSFTDAEWELYKHLLPESAR